MILSPPGGGSVVSALEEGYREDVEGGGGWRKIYVCVYITNRHIEEYIRQIDLSVPVRAYTDKSIGIHLSYISGRSEKSEDIH